MKYMYCGSILGSSTALSVDYSQNLMSMIICDA